jgi:hypothetical protein
MEKLLKYDQVERDPTKADLEYVNSVIPTNYSKVVYVNSTSPTTATIFDLDNPPTVNDDLLKNDVNNIYIGTDASTWVYKTSPAGYVTKAVVNTVSNQIEIGTSQNIQELWKEQTILFKNNCTITVPNTLSSQFGFVFRTLAGVTVTWAITAPFTWETTPSTTPEKTTGSFMRRGSTNTILLDF